MGNLVVYDIMGFEKRYLPDLKSIVSEYETLGHEEFVRKNSRYEALIGPTESVKFVTEQIKKNKKDQCTTTSHE